MICRSNHCRPAIIEKLLTVWNTATYREKKVFVEQTRAEALEKLRSACESISASPTKALDDRHGI